MCDSKDIARLYDSVLQDDIFKYDVHDAAIRTGIQNMKEVYKPQTNSLQTSVVDVANYNDPAHRCAYLHKYAPFHTALVAEMLERAIQENLQLFQSMIVDTGCVKLCSLGGGPGSDLIGVVSILNKRFGFFQISATIIDIMGDWEDTFSSLVEELRYGGYGTLGDCVAEQYFEWNYIQSNLLGKMAGEVNKAIGSANLLTMIKFVSAAACDETSEMIRKVFRSMKSGSFLLYIDNAGGGFHQLINKEARSCGMKTIFGPLKHEHYVNHSFNVKRCGYTPCLETKVSVHVWKKPNQNQRFVSNNAKRPMHPNANSRTILPSIPNENQTKMVRGNNQGHLKPTANQTTVSNRIKQPLKQQAKGTLLPNQNENQPRTKQVQKQVHQKPNPNQSSRIQPPSRQQPRYNSVLPPIQRETQPRAVQRVNQNENSSTSWSLAHEMFRASRSSAQVPKPVLPYSSSYAVGNPPPPFGANENFYRPQHAIYPRAPVRSQPFSYSQRTEVGSPSFRPVATEDGPKNDDCCSCCVIS